MFITISQKVSSVRYVLVSLGELANKESVCLPDYNPPGVAEGMTSDMFHVSYSQCFPYCRHHDDIWTWKHFPHHFTCYGKSTSALILQRRNNAELYIFFVFSLKKLLDKQSSSR